MKRLTSTNTARLRAYIQDMTRLVAEHGANEPRMLADGETLLKDLIANDDWLPDEFAVPSTESYRQYLLHCDPLERFSVVSFVWGPGQKTPVHDHTVWGLVGVMRGAELCREYAFRAGVLEQTGEHQVGPGAIDLVSPTLGDVHMVSNADPVRASISVHCYGANIGAVRRHVFDADIGTASEFISGYSSTVSPNLWDRSTENA